MKSRDSVKRSKVSKATLQSKQSKSFKLESHLKLTNNTGNTGTFVFFLNLWDEITTLKLSSQSMNVRETVNLSNN